MRSLQRVIAALGPAALLLVGFSATTPAVAGAVPSQQPCGNTTANPSISVDRPTVGASETATVTVTGRSYLLPPHVCGTDVFGGVYLFFGWVQPGGQWGPSFKSSTSTRGLFGTSYSYPGEGGGAETRDDGTGTVRLISFTAGGESGSATPFHMDGRGNWQSTLTVRGATYSYKDLRTGASSTVDCRIVQCGVFTIGAHGKASRTNERFVPINFVDPSGTPIVPSNPNGAGAGGVTSSAPGGAPGSTDVATGSGGDVGSTSQDVGAETTIPDTVGPVGEAPTTTEGATDDDTDQEDLLDVDETASVQDFGGDDGGGGGAAGVVLGAAAVLVALLVGGGVLVLRRRAAGPGVAS